MCVSRFVQVRVLSAKRVEADLKFDARVGMCSLNLIPNDLVVSWPMEVQSSQFILYMPFFVGPKKSYKRRSGNLSSGRYAPCFVHVSHCCN